MRLLQRTIRLYSVLSLAVLLIGVPVFYFLLRSVIREEVDEELIVGKSQVVDQLAHLAHDSDWKQIRSLDQQIFVGRHPVTGKITDRFSTFRRYDTVIHETINIRRLDTYAQVNGKSYSISLTTPMVDHNDLIRTVMFVQAFLLVLLFVGIWIINKTVASTYLLQKEFTENAAHEMQTPLAVLQGQLELLMQAGTFTEAQTELIGKMADTSQRMNKLNKGLLLLVRISNNLYQGREKVDWSAALDTMLAQYEEAISQKNIRVSIEKPASMKTEINRTLMELLVGNLLSNAIRHNIVNGTLGIRLTERELVIDNSGPDKALNTVNLFQRFQKDSGDPASLGLGLEIVDRICTLQQYALRYQYHPGHHRFSVRF